MDVQVHTINHEYDSMPAGLTWQIIGQPKTGKTTQAAQWSERGHDGVILLDADWGSDFARGANVVTLSSINAPIYQVYDAENQRYLRCDEHGVVLGPDEPDVVIPPIERGFYFRSGPQKGEPLPAYAMSEVLAWLSAQWDTLPYDTIAIDTVDEVNHWIEQLTIDELNIYSMGDAEWGKDWSHARKRNLNILKQFQTLIKQKGANLVLVAHSKQTTITDDKVQLLPDIPRGLAYAVAAKADIIGYTTMNRQANRPDISFKAFDERAIGSRLRPLAQKKLPFDYQVIRNEILTYAEEDEEPQTDDENLTQAA